MYLATFMYPKVNVAYSYIANGFVETVIIDNING